MGGDNVVGDGAMSMAMCKDCDRIFDTDDDPDCFIEVGNMRRYTEIIMVCEPCREKRLEKKEADAAQASWAEAQAEKESK